VKEEGGRRKEEARVKKSGFRSQNSESRRKEVKLNLERTPKVIRPSFNFELRTIKLQTDLKGPSP
jgi:hypothetical protein